MSNHHTSQRQALAERQDARAMDLFDEEQVPVRPDVLQLVKEGQYHHKGVRLLENEQLCLRLVELLLVRWGMKKIAAELRISKHTVRAARDELVRRGELAPWKERVLAKFNEIIEAGADRYLEGIEKGTISAAQIPIGLGIIFDKRQLALGEPTSIGISGQVALDREKLSVQALNAWVQTLDSHSTDLVRIPAQSGAGPGLDAGLAAARGSQAQGAGGGSGGPEVGHELTGLASETAGTKGTA